MIPVPAVAVISFLSGISQLDLDRALRCVDARAHHLALLAADLPVAKVAEPSRAKLSDAGVADALAAAERKLEPRLLACHEDRLRPIRLRLGAAGGEDDPAGLALAPVGAEPVEVAWLQAAAGAGELEVEAIPAPAVTQGGEPVAEDHLVL